MAKILSVVLGVFFLFSPVPAAAETLFPFTGEFDLQQKSLTIAVHPEADSPVVVELSQSDDRVYHISVNIKDWQTAFFNMSTVIEGTVDVKRNADGTIHSLVGKVESQYTLFNHQPIQEMVGQFEIRQGRLTIQALSLGSVNMKGSILLKSPYTLDLQFQLAGVPLEDFIAFFAGRPKFIAEGLVDGEIAVSGPIDHLNMKGSLFSDNGTIKGLEYSSIVLNAQGIYPLIVVGENSTIVQTDGAPFHISGSINLAEKGSFSKQLAALAKTPVVSYERDHLEWTLKRIQSEKEPGTTELKYLMRKGDDRDHTGDSSEDMIGVERKMEF